MLLARAMSSPGHATNRLAQVLDTIAPDEQRKRRVLTLAKKLISERDFGSKRPIDDIRQSLDELLLQVRRVHLRIEPTTAQSMDQAGVARRRTRRARPAAGDRASGSRRSATKACAGCRASC